MAPYFAVAGSAASGALCDVYAFAFQTVFLMRVSLWITVLCHACFFAISNLLCLWSFSSSLVDIGSFQQILWMASKGIAPTTSINLPYAPDISWFGFHFTPLVFVLTPLFIFYPGPEWFALIHAACVSGTAILVFHICRRLSLNEKTAFLWACCYLLHPITLFTSLWEFHEQSLATPLIAGALLAIITHHRRWFLTCLILLLLTKEHYGLVMAGCGIVWAVIHKEYRLGSILVTIGIAVFLAIVFGLMPLLNQGAVSMFASVAPDRWNYHLSRYHWLSWEWPEKIGHALLLLKSKATIAYYLVWLIPLLGLPLLGCIWLIPALPELGISWLSDYQGTRSFLSYHTASSLTAGIVAAVVGSKRLISTKRGLSLHEWAQAAFCLHVVFALIFMPIPPWPMPKTYDKEAFFYPDTLKELREKLPEEKAVSASKTAGVYFANRRYMYKFPYGVERADAVVWFVGTPYLSHGRWFAETTSERRRALLPEMERVLQDPHFGVTYMKGPWILLERDKPSTVSLSQVRAMLYKEQP